MRETLLIKIALCCILLGLPALYIISDAFSISDIAGRATGTSREDVVEGKVTSVKVTPERTTLLVTTTTKIIIFDNVAIPMNRTVTAKGRKENGTLIANEVRID